MLSEGNDLFPYSSAGHENGVEIDNARSGGVNGLTAKQQAGFRHDIFDVNGRLFRFGRHVAARSYYNEGIRLTVCIFQVKTMEKYSSCGNHSLS